MDAKSAQDKLQELEAKYQEMLNAASAAKVSLNKQKDAMLAAQDDAMDALQQLSLHKERFLIAIINQNEAAKTKANTAGSSNGVVAAEAAATVAK
jgi:hypothetical protein